MFVQFCIVERGSILDKDSCHLCSSSQRHLRVKQFSIAEQPLQHLSVPFPPSFVYLAKVAAEASLHDPAMHSHVFWHTPLRDQRILCMMKRRHCYKLRIGRHILQHVDSQVHQVASIVEAMVAFVDWVLALEREVVVGNLDMGRDIVAQMPAVVALLLCFRLVALVVDDRSSSLVGVEGNSRKVPV